MAALLVLATVCMGWPVFPFFAGIRPMILGLPLSLAWVVLWMVVVFVAQLALYLRDDSTDREAQSPVEDGGESMVESARG